MAWAARPCSSGKATHKWGGKPISAPIRDWRTGFAKIGYHWVIRRDGTVEADRPEASASVHDDVRIAKNTISICLIGGANEKDAAENSFTDEQQDTVHKLVNEIAARHDGVLTSVAPGIAFKIITPAISLDQLEHWI